MVSVFVGVRIMHASAPLAKVLMSLEFRPWGKHGLFEEKNARIGERGGMVREGRFYSPSTRCLRLRRITRENMQLANAKRK